MKRTLRPALRLTGAVIESARLEDESVVLVVRPYERVRRRCPVCGRACAAHDDDGGGPRRWRTLDLGASRCYLEHAPARVSCPGHGVRVESVPWARHGSRFPRPFEDRVAWMTVHRTTSAVARACRVEWHSVGGICDRVFRDLRAPRGGSRYDGVRRIGIDETSYKKGHKYLMVVVDHDRGRLIWAAALLDDWPHRAAYRGIGKVVEVEGKVRRRRDDIPRAVEPGIGNARVGATNDKVKVTVRMGYGFRNIDNLIAPLIPRRSDIEPSLPWERPVHVGRAA